MSTCLRSPVELSLWLQPNAAALLFLLPLCGCSDTASLEKQVTSLSQQVASLQIKTFQLEKELRSSHAIGSEGSQSWNKYKRRLSNLEERLRKLDGEIVSDDPVAALMIRAQGRVGEVEERLEGIEARLQ